MKQWYESIFENFGKKYDNESFVQGTIGECDFIYGAKLGAFSRDDKLTKDDFEMLVIAEK